jgi:cytochrome P450
MDVKTSLDLTGTFAGDLHGVLREAAQHGPLAVDVATGAVVVLRQRPDTPRLLNFGAGTHYCVGHALAKIAVEESVRALLVADPPLCLAEDPADIPWRQVLGRSPVRLIVSSERAA